RPRVNPLGRTPSVVLAWTATLGTERARPLVSTAIPAANWSNAFSAGFVLDCFFADASRMACAGTVHAGDAFAILALLRTGIVFCGGASVLVASCAALAGCRDRAAMVDPFVSLPCDVAVRSPFRISRVL